MALRGLDYSQPWHEDYVENRAFLQEKLHLLHPAMLACLQLCEDAFGTMVLIDITDYRLGPCTVVFRSD